MSNGSLRSFASRVAIGTGLAGALFAVTGCGIGPASVANVATGAAETTVPGVRINGHVHGAAYPIQNATVILMETQSNGSWTASSNNYIGTAKPLYATQSDAYGSFNFPDTGWSCDAGQYLYIEVTNGQTANAAGSNPNVVQLGVVGSCAADLANKAEIDGLNVFLSEPSTVAAAYALRSFISIHSGNLTGVANDGTITAATTIPIVDITSAPNDNVIPAIAGLNTANPVPGPVQAPLSSVANNIGITTDGKTFTGGFDSNGSAISATLVGTSLTYAGVPYTLLPADQNDVARNTTITIPTGNFTKLHFLAAGTNGNQATQTFTVNYADGTSANFTQSVSDWYTPQNYNGETTALAMSYRNSSNGTKDNRAFNIYHYSFTLSPGKAVTSLKLPANNNVSVLAVTLVPAGPECSGIRLGVALNCTAAGLTHAFQNAYNLVDQVTFSSNQFPSGQARLTIPGNSATVAPQQMLNTLGNILQSCVDSTGGTVADYNSYTPGAPTSTRCGDLFYWSTKSGGTTPTNTLQAALNMATYPTNNVDRLFALQPRAVFFTPDMITQPSAFTLSIFYKGTDKGDTFNAPADVALDLQDNVYVAYGAGATATLDELTSSGTGVFTKSLASVANSPKAVAVDMNNYVWVADDTPNPGGTLGNLGGVVGFYTSNNATSGNPAGTSYKTLAIANGSAAGLAFDPSSNMFVTRDSGDANASAFLLTQSSAYATSSGYKLNYPIQRAALDAVGNFYAVGTNGTSSEWLIYPYATCGTAMAPTTVNANIKGASSMALNNNSGANEDYAFVAASGQLISVTATGNCNGITISSPVNSYSNSAINTPAGAAMDGGLSVFWSDNASGLIYELANVGNSTDISTASALSFAPCYVLNGTCTSTNSAKYSGMAIDSSGAMWYLSGSGTYGLVQTIGLADPTWPLLASGNSGVAVQ